MDAASVRPAIRGRIEPDTILCTDDLNVYKALTSQLGLQHETLSATWGERVCGPFHIQNFNSDHSRLKNWIRRFKGVSTRYLPHYVGWFRTLDVNGHGHDPEFMLQAEVLSAEWAVA